MRTLLEAARAIAALMLCISCIGCSRAEPTNPEPLSVQPQPDQVLFFERPLTLAAARKAELAIPIVVLLDSDRWGQVIGSDSPTFALYADGTIIYRTAAGFRKSRLAQQELKQFLDRLNLDAMSHFYGLYRAQSDLDQPEQNLLVYSGEKPVFIKVYGSLKDHDVRSKIPSEIVSLYDTLSGFRHPSSESWLPEHVEVMIWPYEHAPDPSIEWPGDWPDLSDDKTVRRGEDSFSIFMPSTKLMELRSFLARRSEKGAIEIDGRKWSASIRYPFPHEELWIAPHPELESARR